MKLASRQRNTFWEVQAWRAFKGAKLVRQRLRYRPGAVERIAMIVGCQRSGTSLFNHIFQRDLDCISYDEISPLSNQDQILNGFRLNPIVDLRARFARERAPLVVFKPLVESQRADELLTAFPAARAIWLYRHYKDVAKSNVEFFADPDHSRRDLAPILAGDNSDWRCERLAESARETVRRLAGPDLTPLAAASLFWWARNSLFFQLGLDREPRVRLCRYEDLVESPARVIGDVYEFLGRPYPGDSVVRDVVPTSRGRGRSVELPAAIDELCRDLLGRLDLVLHATV